MQFRGFKGREVVGLVPNSAKCRNKRIFIFSIKEKAMKRKVVVTGMGLVCPIGNSVNEFCENLKARQKRDWPDYFVRHHRF